MFVCLESLYLCYLKAHEKFRNPTTTPSGRMSNEPEERMKRERYKKAIYSGPRAAHLFHSDQQKQAFRCLYRTKLDSRPASISKRYPKTFNLARWFRRIFLSCYTSTIKKMYQIKWYKKNVINMNDYTKLTFISYGALRKQKRILDLFP